MANPGNITLRFVVTFPGFLVVPVSSRLLQEIPEFPGAGGVA